MNTQLQTIPRLLVVSTNVIRKGGSNGRLLAELLGSWPSNKLAQFYTYNELPEENLCSTYYRVTDKDALQSFLTGKKVGNEVFPKEIEKKKVGAITKHGVQPKKNSLTYLLRDIVWNSNRWLSEDFWMWCDRFRPEAVLILAGASSYPHNTARKIADRYEIPLIILNSENYYLKDYNYLKGRGWDFIYPLYKWECDRGFRRLMKRSTEEVYINDKLSNDYNEAFGRPGVVIHQGSSLSRMPEVDNETPIFSYAGNLGIDRHKALIEIAMALQKISKTLKLNVYGRALSDEVEHALQGCPGIDFHGMVPYEKVLQVMKESDFMVHAESFEPFWIKDLSTAFSTKIADVLRSGKCLVLYAAPSFACTQYVLNNDCGCVITSPDLLDNKLREIIENKPLRKHYVANAILSAERDMDSKKNSEYFKQLVVEIIKNENGKI